MKMDLTPTSAYNDKLFNYILGSLLAGGGSYGYYRTKSVPSLIAGIGLGLLYGYSGYLINERQYLAGYQLSFVTSLILAAAMGRRGYQTQKSMPLALAGLGSLSALNMGYKLYTFK